MSATGTIAIAWAAGLEVYRRLRGRENPAIKFFPGHHHSSDAGTLKRAMIARQNVNLPFEPPDEWMLDSGGFAYLTNNGSYPGTPADYVEFVGRCEEQAGGELVAAIAEDYPPTIDVRDAIGEENIEPTLSKMTTERLRAQKVEAVTQRIDTPIVPVLHGREMRFYETSLAHKNNMIGEGDLVAIGGLAGHKWDIQDGNADAPRYLYELVSRLLDMRPDLRLHALGIGAGVLRNSDYGAWLQRHLYSADSAAWSLRARYAGDDPNDPDNAALYAQKIEGDTQQGLFEQEGDQQQLFQ